eukprot:SAG11_NODE_723_length_7528_cov_4.998385_5_plen_172_part_00
MSGSSRCRPRRKQKWKRTRAEPGETSQRTGRQKEAIHVWQAQHVVQRCRVLLAVQARQQVRTGSIQAGGGGDGTIVRPPVREIHHVSAAADRTHPGCPVVFPAHQKTEAAARRARECENIAIILRPSITTHAHMSWLRKTILQRPMYYCNSRIRARHLVSKPRPGGVIAYS